MFLEYNSLSIEYHLSKISFPFHRVIWKIWMSVNCSVCLISRRYVLSIFLFWTAERYDQIITGVRRNEKHYISSGNNDSKTSLTIAYHRRTQVYNKLHNFYRWTTRKITHLKLFETPTNKLIIIYMFIILLIIYMHVVLFVFMYLCRFVHL